MSAAATKIIDTVKFYKPTFIIQWNHWARTVAMAAGQLTFVGGIISTIAYGFPIHFLLGLYAIAVGIFVFTFSYPLQTLQKRGLVVIFQKYQFAGPGLLAASIPCFFSMPIMLGAFTLALSGTFYLLAAIRKEKSLTKEQIMKGANL